MNRVVQKLTSLSKKQRAILAGGLVILISAAGYAIYKKIEADKSRAEISAFSDGVKQGIKDQLGDKTFDEVKSEIDTKYPPQDIKFYKGLKFPTYTVTQTPQQLPYYQDYFVELEKQYVKELDKREGNYFVTNKLGSQDLIVDIFSKWHAFSKQEVNTSLGDYQLWLRGEDYLSQEAIYIDIDSYADFEIGNKAGCEQLMRKEFNLDEDGIPSLAYKTFDFHHQKSKTHNTCIFIGEGTVSRSLDIKVAISTDTAPTEQLILRTLIPQDSNLLPEVLEVLKSVEVREID